MSKKSYKCLDCGYKFTETAPDKDKTEIQTDDTGNVVCPKCQSNRIEIIQII